MAPARTVNEKVKNEIIGVALVAMALLCLAGLYILDAGYLSSAASIGAAGQLLVGFLKALTGEGKYVFPLFLAAWGIRLINGGRVKDSRPRLIGGIILFLTLLSALHQQVLYGYTAKEIVAQGLAGHGGGLLGALGALLLKSIFGRVGTWIVLMALGVSAFLLATGVSLSNLARRLVKLAAVTGHTVKGWLLAFLFTEVEDEESEPQPKRIKARGKSLPREREAVPVVINPPLEQSEDGDHPAGHSGRTGPGQDLPGKPCPAACRRR